VSWFYPDQKISLGTPLILRQIHVGSNQIIPERIFSKKDIKEYPLMKTVLKGCNYYQFGFLIKSDNCDKYNLQMISFFVIIF